MAGFSKPSHFQQGLTRKLQLQKIQEREGAALSNHIIMTVFKQQLKVSVIYVYVTLLFLTLAKYISNFLALQLVKCCQKQCHCVIIWINLTVYLHYLIHQTEIAKLEVKVKQLMDECNQAESALYVYKQAKMSLRTKKVRLSITQ